MNNDIDVEQQIEDAFQALHDIVNQLRINRKVAEHVKDKLLNLQDIIESSMEFDPVDF